MKYAVRYEVEGFIEKELFKNYRDAKKFYNSITKKLDQYLISIDLYEI